MGPTSGYQQPDQGVPAQVAILLSSPVDMAMSSEAPIIGKPGAGDPQPGRSALPSWYNSTPYLAAGGVPSPAAHVHRLPMALPAAGDLRIREYRPPGRITSP